METLNVADQELSVLVVTDKRKAGANSPCQSSQLATNGNMVGVVDYPPDYAAEGAVTASEQLTKAERRLANVLKAI